MKKNISIAFVLFLLTSGMLRAQVNWQLTSGPVGGDIYDIIGLNGTLITATKECHIFLSHDYSNHWVRISDSPSHVYTLCVTAENHIIAGSDDGVYRSADNGFSWTPSGLTGSDVYKLYRSHTGHIYAQAGENGFYRSADNGMNWEYITSTLDGIYLESFCSTADDSLFAISSGQVYRSSHPGITWTDVTGSVAGNTLLDIRVNSQNTLFLVTSQGPYRSTDHGDNWEHVATGLTSVWGGKLAVNAKDDLFFASGMKIFNSTDNGDSWELLHDPFTIRNISVLNVGYGDTLLAGTMGEGLYRSWDGGHSWEAANTGLTACRVRSMTITQGNRLFVGTWYSGIFRSTDSGVSWEQSNQGLTSWDIGPLLCDSQNHLYAGCTGEGLVFRSTDIGETWESVSSGLLSSGIYSLALDENGDLFAGSKNGHLYWTTDKGDTWTEPGPGLPGQSIKELIFTLSGDLFAGTMSGGIYRSSDQGASWETVNSGLDRLTIRSLIVKSDSILFAGALGLEGIYRSTNRGENWHQTSYPGYHANTLFASMDGVLFAGSMDGIFCSFDNGDSWSDISSGISGNAIYAIAADSSGVLFAGTDEGGVYTSPPPVSAVLPKPESGIMTCRLEQNRPNPFNTRTAVTYQLPVAGLVTLSVYNLTGRKVKTLVSENQTAGTHTVHWDASTQASGIYLLMLKSGSYIETRKINLLK